MKQNDFDASFLLDIFVASSVTVARRENMIPILSSEVVSSMSPGYQVQYYVYNSWNSNWIVCLFLLKTSAVREDSTVYSPLAQMARAYALKAESRWFESIREGIALMFPYESVVFVEREKRMGFQGVRS